MTPRDQAIEEAAKAAYAHYTTGGVLEKSAPCIRRDWAEIASAAIDAYLAACARLDGAKMMPREATEEMGVLGARSLRDTFNAPNQHMRAMSVYRAMHDATPKEKE